MEYTHTITSKGQITLPKELRQKLGLDEVGRATLRLNERGEIVVTKPKTLQDVRRELATPSHDDPLTDREHQMGKVLTKKYGVR